MKVFASALVVMALLTESTQAVSINQFLVDEGSCGCAPSPSCPCSKGGSKKASAAKAAAHIDKIITKALDKMDERQQKRADQRKTEEAVKKVEDKQEKRRCLQRLF